MKIKNTLQKEDKKMASLIALEAKRQAEGLEMIPSENYVSRAVLEAMGSVLTNKYSEGYPRRRYYGGNEIIDKIEQLCIDRAKKLFNVPHVNVQPYSGSPANLEIFAAICKVGEPVLSQELSHGGHLSMGQKSSWTSKYFKAYHYHLTKKGEVNWEELEKIARKVKPRIIWSGGTAYTLEFDFKKYSKIADTVGAFFVADVSHIGGLIAGGAHMDPTSYAHVVMTTTHKTLRGPRGAMIMVTKKGLKKDPDLAKKIDFAVFPGHQGGPHENTIAGIAVALAEALKPSFKNYAQQIVLNSKTLANEFLKHGFNLIGGGSENHMVWIDLQNKGIDGWAAQYALDEIGISINRQTIPFDPRPPYYPSGIRLGTPALTTRGMKEKEMKKIANWINEAINVVIKMGFEDIGSKIREKDQKARKKFKLAVKKQPLLKKLRKKVKTLALKFPVPGI